jgi:CRP/FNR family transcriptional regulator, nitrogen oxide reductase regulator
MPCIDVQTADNGCREIEIVMPIDVSLVSGLPLFSGLDTPACEAILKHARAVRFAKSKVIFDQGEAAHSFHLLLHGHVRASKITPAGDQVIVRYVPSGEIFGVAQAIGLLEYPTTATAVEDSIVLSWPTDVWGQLSGRFPLLAVNTLRTVGGKLQEALDRMIDMSTQAVDQRIARALLRLSEQSGRKTVDGVSLDFSLSRRDIAELTGATIFTASRTLSYWEQQGWLDSTRQHIVICDLDAIRALASLDGAGQSDRMHVLSSAERGSKFRAKISTLGRT